MKKATSRVPRALGIAAVVIASVGWGSPAASQIRAVERPAPGVHTSVRRPADATTETDVRATHLETWLTTMGRAEVDGIHFDVAKATISAESEPVLQAIADLSTSSGVLTPQTTSTSGCIA